MSFIPENLLPKIPRLYETENQSAEQKIVWLRLYVPDNVWSLYIIEYDPEERLCFGLVEGFESEMGYFSLTELESIKSQGMKVVRDKNFTPTTLDKLIWRKF